VSDNGTPAGLDTGRRYDSQGKLTVDGQAVNYQASAAWLPLFDGERRRASVFHVYYRRAQRGTNRPLTFVFNGGPGAASAYLHVGALGPRRVDCGKEGAVPAAPARLVDNTESWLAFTDLVFVDPVGTGLSRTEPAAAGGEDAKKEPPAEDTFYWDVSKDLASLCDFIGGFLTREGRWSSPIYLAGESYGGYRVARLLRMLQEKAGIGVSGAMLISPALEWDALLASRFHVLGGALRLPSYAAAARRHGRCSHARKKESLADFLNRAERYAMTEYLPALASGDERDAEFLRHLYAWTGVPEDRLVRHGGMPPIDGFVRELLRDEQRVVGLYDAGVAIDDPFPYSDAFKGVDPTLDGINRLYTVAANQHLRDGLGVDAERQYQLLSYDVNRRWQWRDSDTGSPIPPGGAEDIAVALSINPATRITIVHGIYDLVTPYFDSKYLLQQLARGSRFAEQVELALYEGGHMFYMWQKSRRAFTRDAQALYAP
jgi:carboxypeptidase C (cathepsin A)